jgi:hypothetical protein
MAKAKTGIAAAPKMNAPGPRRMGGVGGVGGRALGKIKPAQVSGLTGSPSAKTVPGLSEHPGAMHNGSPGLGITSAPVGVNQTPLGID